MTKVWRGLSKLGKLAILPTKTKYSLIFADTVDPQSSGPQVSGFSDYPDSIVTAQLEYFVKSVSFIRIFEL